MNTKTSLFVSSSNIIHYITSVVLMMSVSDSPLILVCFMMYGFMIIPILYTFVCIQNRRCLILPFTITSFIMQVMCTAGIKQLYVQCNDKGLTLVAIAQGFITPTVMLTFYDNLLVNSFIGRV